MQHERTDLCIAGGGPAGMVAGLLFARAGIRTTVLEKHADFLRDFRGDTVHPSTLRLFHEMGLLQRLLRRPHNKVHDISAYVGGRLVRVADFSRFDPRWNFIALMPQWEFLDFVASEAAAYPHFRLLMQAQATGLAMHGGRVHGLVCEIEGETRRIDAKLVIAADGRHSVLREEAELPLRALGAPMDVFWFRLPKQATRDNRTTGVFAAGRIMALIDRGDYWQCAYVFAKGEAPRVRERGIEAFREEVAQVAHFVEPRVDALLGWDDVKLLTVALDRLERWHRPGLLVIGDAAHAMSPIGGVGINVAIQDAVAAANILAPAFASEASIDARLARVRARRMLSVRATQAFQRAAQQRIISPLLAGEAPSRPPRALRMLQRFAWLQRLPAAFLGFGLRPEHVRSPRA
jgi:2-polyprenyl-6-methoxyphenol hydroxylase-like FAD-dependent oxidoreductase